MIEKTKQNIVTASLHFQPIVMFFSQHVELGSLWRHQAVVMFFLRRFGCQICRWTAVEISKLEKDLRESTVALIGIGPEDTGLKEFMDGGFFKGGEFRPCSIRGKNPVRLKFCNLRFA